MNSSIINSELEPARYAWFLAGGVSLAAAVLAALSWSLGAPKGDLARIGRLSEADYMAWAPRLRYRKPLYAAELGYLPSEVFVLGDSFAFDDGKAWMTPLAAGLGKELVAAHHGRIEFDAIVSTPEFLKNPPKVFIFEIVERNLKEKLDVPAVCGEGAPWATTSLPRRLPLALETEPQDGALEREVNLGYGWGHLVSSARRLAGRPAGVWLRRLKRPLFSSAKPDVLLAYEADFKKKEWTADVLERIDCRLSAMRAAAEKNGRTRFLALVIPDKLTVYQDEVLDGGEPGVIARLAAKRYELVDPTAALKKLVAAGELDVYLPDDTHLGMRGHAVVAREVLARLRRAKLLK